MPSPLPLLLGLGLLLGSPADPDLGQLQEMLYDRQDARAQSQAAMLLIQSKDDGAARVVRHALKQADQEDAFVALTTAIRMRRDVRFGEDLFPHLSSMKPRVRQVAAETLGAIADAAQVRRLESLARNPKGELRLRQAAVWTLGRSGRQDAAGFLVEMFALEGEEMKRYVAAALAELSGLNHGTDAERWKAWWSAHKDLTTADWFQQRLAFQSARVGRLDGELLRARAQVMRLHQQVYARLGVAERVPYLQALLDQDEPGVRGLAVIWAVEMLPSTDAEKQKALGKLLQKLTHDSNAEVQRGAVLALGRLNDDESFDRLTKLLEADAPAVKAAAIRALSLQARNGTAEGKRRLRPVVPLLQKALEDKTLEVVVEAAEALGALGAPEAGPVLTALLRHPSENVRQTVAQALERMAEPALIDGLLRGLDDTVVTVRFSLLGALARAAGNGQALPASVRPKVIARLESLLRNDTDAGVRGRAATVLGECGDHETLAGLWQHVLTGEGRVQEKAWDAFGEILVRAGSMPLVERWDRAMITAKQSSRRLQMWGRLYTRWEQNPALKEETAKALEGLIVVQLELGKWASAGALIQGMLARGAELPAATRERCLGWATQAADLAIREGSRAEALRLLKEARPSLPTGDKLIATFDQLEKLAGAKP
jgi:HEAT repeat protein